MRWFLILWTTFLLTCANVFMTFAWYSHLRNWGGQKVVYRRGAELGHRVL